MSYGPLSVYRLVHVLAGHTLLRVLEGNRALIAFKVHPISHSIRFHSSCFLGNVFANYYDLAKQSNLTHELAVKYLSNLLSVFITFPINRYIMAYTQEEKVQIIKWFYSGNSYIETQRLFIAAYEDSPIPSRSTIGRIVQRFEKTGSVWNCRCRNMQRRNRVNQEREVRDVMICAAAEENSSLSSRQIAEQVDSSRDVVKRVLKKSGYKSYKISVGHQLLPRDAEMRMVFCEEMTERINYNPRYTTLICFGDESTFPLLGKHNPSVVRFWARENPHQRMDMRTQYPQKLNLWGGVLGSHILGPFFINGNLTGARYLNLLRDHIIPAIQALPDVDINEVWFQQDGCPAHNTVPVRNFLEQIFPLRLIANRGTIHWPPRSPDLSPNDFFLWGTVKQKVYQYPRAENLEELRERILVTVREITQENLVNMRRGFYNRLGYCTANYGGVFEHLL